MSNLSQFVPFAGGGLKSFQTGYIQSGTLSGALTPGEDYLFLDVSVSSVNTAKAIPSFYGNQNNNNNTFAWYSYDIAGSIQSGIVTVRLVSSTSLRVASSTPSPSFARINGRWQIAEAN